jgi:spermidine synthase
VARDAFELDALGLELVVDDALAVRKRERRRFDAILEDIFVGRGDAVRKPDWIPEPAHRLAAKRLRPGGVLVTNTLDEAAVVGRALIAAHEAVVRIEIEDYDNRIFVAGPVGLSARGLRAAVAASPVLAGSLPLMRFRSWQRA